MKDDKRRELYLKSNRGRTTLMTMLKEYFEEKVQSLKERKWCIQRSKPLAGSTSNLTQRLTSQFPGEDRPKPRIAVFQKAQSE